MPRGPVSAGLYGKLPGCGDFVRRRLPLDFVEPWDAWLQQGLEASRRKLGAAWDAMYRDSPVCRFQLAAGLCGRTAVVGVLVPSRDRVGRAFPLTVAALPAPGGSGDAQGWFARAEQLAVAAMRDDLGLDALDQHLAALPSPSAACRAGCIWMTGGSSPVKSGGLPLPDAFTALLAGGRWE